MDTLRYFAAMLTVVVVPPLFLMWLLIHPFAAIWRKLGVSTYAIVIILWIVSIIGIENVYNVQKDLQYFGFSSLTAWLSAPCFIIGVILAGYYYKHLTMGILIGLPEILKEDYPGTLLTEGIYSKIRHPRYVGAYLMVLGWTLLANAPIVYIVTLSLIPVILVIVYFEEKELSNRFGAEFKKYCQKVPRFIPKIFPSGKDYK